jgi:hypothetical protein
VHLVSKVRVPPPTWGAAYEQQHYLGPNSSSSSISSSSSSSSGSSRSSSNSSNVIRCYYNVPSRSSMREEHLSVCLSCFFCGVSPTQIPRSLVSVLVPTEVLNLRDSVPTGILNLHEIEDTRARMLCGTTMTLDHISVITTCVIRREEPLRNVSLLQREHLSNLITTVTSRTYSLVKTHVAEFSSTVCFKPLVYKQLERFRSSVPSHAAPQIRSHQAVQRNTSFHRTTSPSIRPILFPSEMYGAFSLRFQYRSFPANGTRIQLSVQRQPSKTA